MWGVSDAEAPDFRLLCRPYFPCYAASWCEAQAGIPCPPDSVAGNRQPRHPIGTLEMPLPASEERADHSGRTTKQ